MTPFHLMQKRLGLVVGLLIAMAVSGQTISEIESSQNLPDFSYAGYHRSERPLPVVEGPIFNIVEFGAKPNDKKSDRAAIQAAIDAAAKHGGGVVLVPTGRFELGETSNAEPLLITHGNIVMRGMGAGEKGSVLHMSEALPPPPPMRLWASPAAIQVGHGDKPKRVAAIAANVAQGDRNVTVDRTAALKVGDWISLSLVDKSPDLLQSELAGFQVIDKRWSNINGVGIQVAERHQIESLKGNVVRLTVPVIKPIDARYDWHVERFEPLAEVGFEHLRFEGDWQESFVHHRSWRDDGGYTMLSLHGVVNSWVRGCRFVNVNRAGSISGSAQVTVLDTTVEGTPGHSAINFPNSSFCLMARVRDLASQWHSMGVSSTSIGNVIWRCYWESNTCFESHAGQPRHTLIDSCIGGFMAGRAGGALGSLPNHLEGLLLWNHFKTNEPLDDFPFEPLEKSYWRLLQPIIVGMHGTKIDFRAGQSTVISLGMPILEGSLYEYQVKRRLGSLPVDLR